MISRKQKTFLKLGMICCIVMFSHLLLAVTIDNVQVSNLTSSSATITWTTDDTTDGCVHYGLDTTLADTTCDSRSSDDVHYVVLTGFPLATKLPGLLKKPA